MACIQEVVRDERELRQFREKAFIVYKRDIREARAMRKKAEPSTTVTIRVPVRLLPKIQLFPGRTRSDKVKRLIERSTPKQKASNQCG
ncbi:hypothetical protein D0962_04110 [Leptolyngbyaceae cyanobacterium CCMR0082]|uniref:Uncharacterized protein n=1 Tax=Adonisia turfae CCMR0082 TaxID=2304604 RepID=A0A6M0S0I4_9CYAN|nr:hypothetical protein [Adonisia turfae CCMR0082]